MELYKFENKKKSNFFNIFKNKPTQKRGGFLQNLKYAFTENKFIQYLSLAGLGASVIATFTSLNLFGLIYLLTLIGEIAAGYALNNAVAGNEPIVYKNSYGLTQHLKKSAGLLLVSLLMFAVLPPFGVFNFFSYVVLFAGLNGLFQAGITKYNKN